MTARSVALVSCALLASAACQQPRRQSGGPDTISVHRATNPLLDSIAAVLRGVNPVIGDIALLELQAPYYDSPRRAALVWGVRHDHQFQGNFRDELFAVLVVNDSLTRVLQVIDTIPTPRWLDYDLRFERVTPDSIIVVGKGATYGDAPLRRSYGW